MLLSTNDENQSYLAHARHAVRLLDVDARKIGIFAGDPPVQQGFPQVQLDEARRLLKAAEADAAVDAKHAKEAEEAEYAEYAAGETKDQDKNPVPPPEQHTKKKKSRRIDSTRSDAPAEEFDNAAQRWVPEGTAIDPRFEPDE
jgi:hypothetical protein